MPPQRYPGAQVRRDSTVVIVRRDGRPPKLNLVPRANSVAVQRPLQKVERPEPFIANHANRDLFHDRDEIEESDRRKAGRAKKMPRRSQCAANLPLAGARTDAHLLNVREREDILFRDEEPDRAEMSGRNARMNKTRRRRQAH